MTLITPPSDDAVQAAQTALVLHAPEPVESVGEDAAEGMLEPITHGRELEIGQTAKSFTANLTTYSPQSPDFQAQVNDIRNLASAEIVKSSSVSSRMLEGRSSSLAGAKRSGDDATIAVAKTLGDLRSTVEDLTPNAANLTGASKILGFIPGGNKLRKYFQKYESAQSTIDGITKALAAGKDELLKDNSALILEQRNQYAIMMDMKEYIMLTRKIDEELVAQAAALRAAGNAQAATAVENEMLFAVRQRTQDLTTQLAVSLQGYLAMGLIHQNNIELVKGVDRALTTTLSALRTAVIVAKALANQELVLNQIQALESATNKTIVETSILLRQNTARIHEQASNSGVSLETLTTAFDNIYATIDEVDTFKQKALGSMDQTINGLNAQLERARPALERARSVEIQANGDTATQGQIQS